MVQIPHGLSLFTSSVAVDMIKIVINSVFFLKKNKYVPRIYNLTDIDLKLHLKTSPRCPSSSRRDFVITMP